MVAFPQRRGRGKSDGLYDEGFMPDRSRYTGDLKQCLLGADRALSDIAAAIDVLRKWPDVQSGPLLIGGQSRGGILSIAYAGKHPQQVKGVINFVGGWSGGWRSSAADVNETLFQQGGGPIRYSSPDREVLGFAPCPVPLISKTVPSGQ